MLNDSSIRFPGESPAADPSVVPVEGPAQATPASLEDPISHLESVAYGENYEFLPERLQAALRRIVQDFTSESELSRREEIRRIKKAHQFWRGLQYLWWSERDQNWHLPFEQTPTSETSLEDLPRYEFVTNIYQAFGLSIIAVLSQDVPQVRFFPQSAQAEEDIAAAKSATEVAQLVERNNRIGNLIVDESFQLWTSGKVGAYVRYVVDGQRFGFHPEIQISARNVELNAAHWLCGECGNVAVTGENLEALPFSNPSSSSTTPLTSNTTNGRTAGGSQDRFPQDRSASRSSLLPTGGVASPPTTPAKGTATPPPPPPGFCPDCGAAFELEDWVPADVVTIPTAETRLRVPNGQEVVTIVGGLELKTPPWANEMHEYPFLQWNMEVHQARLKAAYPQAADKIGPPVASGAVQYERLARLAQSQGGPLTEGGDYNMNLITFQRTWLRPWSFYQLEDKKLRDELLALFPDGCYVAFAGDTYCESRSENMDDHWRVLHALPGDGSTGRPALGDTLISVQERFNTLSNIQIETYEYGIPPIYADSEVLDFDALQSTTAEPGAHYPARAKPGQSLAAGFFQPAPAQIPPDLAMHAANLMGPVAQFLTGAFPALFGGAMANTDTAAGYSMARDQAMGRIGLVWRRMKFFHSDVMLLAVDCFRKNRPSDVETTLLGAGSAFESKWIRLADLKGNLFSFPETDEQYPTLWSQQRAVLLQLLGSPDPQLQQVLSHPENMALVKRLIGLEEIIIPDEESRTKQFREIAQLVTEQSILHRDPKTGVETILPSILPDAFADNHAVELATCKRWFSSDSGQVAKIESPAGYANVRAHALLHQQFLLQQAVPPAAPQSTAGPAA
jgi:hypothetical protein